MSRDPRRVGGVPGVGPVGPVSPARPLGRDEDQREAARDFQARLRREYLDWRAGDETRSRRVASGFGERVIVSGERAMEALGMIERLHRGSPTFRGVLEASIARGDTLWIVIGRGFGYSSSTIGAKDEKVMIDLDQGDLLDLLIHECGHALAGLDDGPLGGFGPNQRFQAVVKREMDLARGGIAAYGEEVRGPEPEGRSG